MSTTMSAMSTTTTMAMASTTSMAMAMSSTMAMTFNTENLATKLLSTTWAPTTTGQYVGSWFFVFFLAVIWRALVFAQKLLDQHWIRKYSAQHAENNTFRDIPAPVSRTELVQAWRLSVNLPRAAVAYVIQSIAYLLMILVMTMNVGFFFAATIGFFFGELIFGRLGFSYICKA